MTPALSVDLPEDAKVSELLEEIYRKVPALRVWDSSVLVGSGVEFVDRNYVIQSNEELAIMPPFQGG